MPITIDLMKSGAVPVVICDVCGKPIHPKKKDAPGTVYWSVENKIGARAPEIVFVHSECVTAPLDVRYHESADLDVWLLWLFNNTVADRKGAEARARLLDRVRP
jgi:hypothetical protein